MLLSVASSRELSLIPLFKKDIASVSSETWMSKNWISRVWLICPTLGCKVVNLTLRSSISLASVWFVYIYWLIQQPKVMLIKFGNDKVIGAGVDVGAGAVGDICF